MPLAQELISERDQVIQDCEHFDIQRPEFEKLEEAQEDIAVTQQAWARYGNFLEEKRTLANRDWISVRSKLYEVEDFVSKWNEDLKVCRKWFFFFFAFFFRTDK